MSTISSDEPEAVKLLRGPLSKRATSAEFNEWQAREVVAYIDSLLSLREDGEGWVLVPREPTEAMLDAIMDPQSPFIGRRKMDKSGGEVVEQTNEDWRNTIGGEDDFRHRGDFKNEREAMQQADRLSAAWRLSNAIAAAPSNPGTSKVENSRST